MYYDKKYLLTQDDKIVLYGAATTGAILYKSFTKQNLNVVAFVDMRADEIPTYYELPVWNLNQLQEYLSDNEAVVVIAIKNVFEHEKIAKKIYEIGGRKIIFRPYRELNGQGREEEKVMNQLYSTLLSGVYSGSGYRISGIEKNEMEDSAIIEMSEEYIIANIHIFYIFTDNYKNRDIIWGDIPCLGLIPHIGLFKAFLGHYNEDEAEYIKFCREAALRSGGIVISQAWEKSVYNNRLDVFNNMQYAWEFDSNFFVRNAVEADYNPKGYFNIKSGKHRIVYQLVKGKRYIPLKLKKEDYYLWRNEKNAAEVSKLLFELKQDSLPFKLGNPYFYKFPCTSSNFYESVIEKLIYNLYKERYNRNIQSFEGKKILFINTDLVFGAYIFQFIGMEVYVYETDEDKCLLLDKVLGNMKYVNEKELESEYNYIVVEDSEKIENNVEKILYITDTKQQDKEEIASGYVDNRYLFAYLEEQKGR